MPRRLKQVVKRITIQRSVNGLIGVFWGFMEVETFYDTGEKRTALMYGAMIRACINKHGRNVFFNLSDGPIHIELCRRRRRRKQHRRHRNRCRRRRNRSRRRQRRRRTDETYTADQGVSFGNGVGKGDFVVNATGLMITQTLTMRTP